MNLLIVELVVDKLYCAALEGLLAVHGLEAANVQGPFTEVLRMTRYFRALPMERKGLPFRHGLRDSGAKQQHRKTAPVMVELPNVTYSCWHFEASAADDDEHGDAVAFA